MGFFKKILKDVAGDYVPDAILNKVIKDDADKDYDDEEEELDEEELDEEELDEEELDEEEDIEDDEEEETSDRKKSKSNVLNTPPPPAVPVPQESLSVMVAVNGESYGPYEKVTLIDMIQNGSLTRETYVYMQGMSEWRAAKDVPRVSVLFAPVVPKPAAPPVPWSNPASAPAPEPAQSTNGFSTKLNSLIESAVADGEISDLERQVLVRNAQAEGVAMDEFVMVLEARLYERRQELMRMQKEQERKVRPQVVHVQAPVAAPAPAAAPKQNAVSKCPHCGAPVKQLATSCPECGNEYPVGMGGNQGTASERLAKAIEEAREKARNSKNGLFSSIKSLTDRVDKVAEAHSIAIKNFPVPTNKSDILDLFSTCATNSKSGFMTPLDEKAIAEAYKKKASEILIKARIVLKDDPDLLQNIESIAKKYKIK